MASALLHYVKGKREKDSVSCDNPHLSGQQLHQNPHQTCVCPTHQISLTQPCLAWKKPKDVRIWLDALPAWMKSGFCLLQRKNSYWGGNQQCLPCSDQTALKCSLSVSVSPSTTINGAWQTEAPSHPCIPSIWQTAWHKIDLINIT